MKFKNPAENRGKRKSLDPGNSTIPVTNAEDKPKVEDTSFLKNVISEPVIVQSEGDLASPALIKEKETLIKELEALKIENQNLKTQIEYEKKKLRHVLEEASKDLGANAKLISSLKNKLRRVSDMLADGVNYMNILQMMGEGFEEED
jgi:hypothetical protein